MLPSPSHGRSFEARERACAHDGAGLLSADIADEADDPNHLLPAQESFREF